MHTIDAIILSNTINEHYYNLLSNCISTLRNNDLPINIIVIETNTKLKNLISLSNVNIKFIFPNEVFNYNKFLNIGIKESTTDNILISNNDIIYANHCVDILYQNLKSFDSVCPLDKNNIYHKPFKDSIQIIEGHEVGKHVVGYSILFKKEILQKIGTFDENFKFWYQDNDYCNLLKKHSLKHALITNAECHHFGSQSHQLLNPQLLKEYTQDAINILKTKWNE